MLYRGQGDIEPMIKVNMPHCLGKLLFSPQHVISWLLYLFLFSLVLFGYEKTYAYFSPLNGLAPLGARLEKIEHAVNGDDFSFAVVGDNKNDKAIFPRLLQKINSDPQIKFIIHTGDLIRSPERSYVKDIMKTLSVVGLQKPLLTIPGNHDSKRNSGSLYHQAFGPLHAVFNLGQTLFVLVDTTAIGTKSELDWLSAALQQKKSAQNVLVFMHSPLYDPRPDGDHCLPKQAGDMLKTLFINSGVKHVYSGHVHGYWSGAWDSLPYTITAGGGATLYSTDPAHGFYHYVKVTVVGGKIDEEVVAVDASLNAGLTSKIGYFLRSTHMGGCTMVLGVMLFLCSGFCMVRARLKDKSVKSAVDLHISQQQSR
jgi:predicted phosphodiesterase